MLATKPFGSAGSVLVTSWLAAVASISGGANQRLIFSRQ
jgi:hypothetical protein